MTAHGSRYTKLQERIGYQFSDRGYLDEALRHPSVSGDIDNQRLEFLGDRVLGLVIAEALFARDPKAKEGDLAPRLNHLVRKERCAEVAEELRLGDEIKLGRSEAMSGGRRKLAVLGDVMEALIAAIYLDGGFGAARDFILKNWQSQIDEVPEDVVDPKTRLQELIQKDGSPPPDYELIGKDGPDHDPLFTVEVRAKGKSAIAKGKSKRSAQANAARILIEDLEGKPS